MPTLDLVAGSRSVGTAGVRVGTSGTRESLPPRKAPEGPNARISDIRNGEFHRTRERAHALHLSAPGLTSQDNLHQGVTSGTRDNRPPLSVLRQTRPGTDGSLVAWWEDHGLCPRCKAHMRVTPEPRQGKLGRTQSASNCDLRDPGSRPPQTVTRQTRTDTRSSLVNGQKGPRTRRECFSCLHIAHSPR